MHNPKTFLLTRWLLYYSVIVILFIGSDFTVFAQQAKISHVNSPIYGIIGSMAQDKSGFIWITSRRALFRYDGYEYKRFAPRADRIFPLETLFIDRKGVIWIATIIEGLYRFEPKTETWTYFQHDPKDSLSLPDNAIKSILEDSKGNLWIGTDSGLAKYDPKTNKFHTYVHDPKDANSISSNTIRKLYEDRQGTLWIGTGSVWWSEGVETDEGGLNRFDEKTGKFIRYLHDPKNPKSLINNKVQAIFEDSRGVFWVGTAEDGLHTMNRATGEFERHLHNPTQPEKLSRPELKANNFGTDHITFITEDATKQIWIGTLGNGLVRYDPATQIARHYGENRGPGDRGMAAWSFCNSRDGVLLVGTFNGALYRVDPFHKDFQYSFLDAQVYSFEEDLSHNFWIGTDKGIFVKSPVTGATRQYLTDPQNPNSLSGNSAFSIFCDPSGTIWVGTDNGLNRFNPATHSFTRYLHDPAVEASLIETNSINAISEAGGDSLWIATSNGLERMNKITGKFTHFQHTAQDSNSIGGNIIRALLPEKSGNLWVATSNFGGLNFLDRKKGIFTRYLTNILIYSLLGDSEGTMWVGTGDGLYKRKKNEPNNFKLAYDINIPGITGWTVGLVEDDRKNIWALTGSGILQINLKTDQVKLFANDFGVDLGRFLYAGKCYKSESGRIYIGDRQGFYTIDPTNISKNLTPPEITLTDFKINGQPVPRGEDSPLTGPLENLKNLLLRHNQNTLTFNIVGIHYANPDRNRLLYRLGEYDPEWREASADKAVYYVNLSPGHYNLKIKAASSEDVWAERSIEIIILPPWWRTWWAYTLYGLIFLTCIYFIDRFQRKRIAERERAKARERELAQAKEIEKAYSELKSTQAQLIQSEKMASLGELTAGIAHEIQNPLNFVNNYAEVNVELIDDITEELEKGSISEAKDLLLDLKDNETKIHHHGKRADSIVRSMMQHSRTNSGTKELTDLNALADEYLRLSYHGLRAKASSFQAEFRTEFDETLPMVEVVQQDMGRVLLNIINNAFQACAERSRSIEHSRSIVNERRQIDLESYQPAVKVSTRKLAESVEISIADNGNGISEAIKEKIFQPFFTTKPTGQGTGLGLSLAYDIVKAHDGELKVASKSGEGTEFIITLPIV